MSSPDPAQSAADLTHPRLNTLCILLPLNKGDIAPHHSHNPLIVATDHYRTISKITSLKETRATLITLSELH